MKTVSIDLIVVHKRVTSVVGIISDEPLEPATKIDWDKCSTRVPTIEHKSGVTSFKEQYENMMKIAEIKCPHENYEIRTLVEALR
jgi:hypothetical protein